MPPSPQKENGYTPIANEIVEAMMRVNFSPHEMRILLFLFRKTYGWKKKSDRLSLSQFARGTGIDRRHVHRAIKNLSAKKVITVTRTGDRKALTYRFQKDYSLWKLSPVQMTEKQTVTSTDDKTVTSTGTHKRKKEKKIVHDRKRPRPKKSTNPDIKLFLDWWVNRYEKLHGTPYHLNGGKDGKITQRLLETYQLEHLTEMAETFLQMDDPFIEKAGRTVGVFNSMANKLASATVEKPLTIDAEATQKATGG